MNSPTGPGASRIRVRRFLYLLAVLLALIVRMAYLSTTDPRELYTRWSTTTDAQVYDQFGWNLATRGVMGVGERPSGFVMPAYPLLIAGVYRVTGHFPGAVRWIQAILSLSTVLALGRLARFLSGPRAEILAVAAGGIYPHFLYFTGEILTETLFLFSFAGMVLTAFRIGREGRAWDGILHGLCLTVAALTRPVGLFLEPAVLILARPWARECRRSRIAGLLLGFLLFGAAWGGWIVRNRAVFGETVLFDTHGGFALYLGHLLSTGASQEEIARSLGYSHKTIAEGRLPGGPRGEIEADRRCGKAVREIDRRDPAGFVREFLRNVGALWLGLDFSDVAGGSHLFGLVSLVGWVAYGPILLLGGAGAWGLFRERRWIPLAAILGIFLISSLIHGLVVGGQRYRTGTLDPFLLVLSAGTLDRWLPRRAEETALTSSAGTP